MCYILLSVSALSNTRFFFNDTATTEIYTSLFVGSVRCVYATAIEVLQGFIKTAAPIAALKGKQTENQEFDKDGNAVLSDDQLAICSQLGVSPEEFAKTLKEEK
mgnify:CR=1 FL=1